ncbi:MAG: UDP-N-acetylmuramoyl-tripeptide--D-alanyl-D-alanine ligase [Actinobacteria bacterium]|nr:UDP-N-acetylmuramoyl-tripeptide--D-alanyl-D-alanine ligase [Actinomycetota bacterium]MCL5887298.1 UDP-N-acetylmuramoyl-tripeptide--D-alanyl-D-alanine ligase [Actinomycetota bacterium]
MLTLSAGLIAEVTAGEILLGNPDVMANGLQIDSRQVEPGNLFVAFAGERVDGHDFLEEAISAGARVLLVTEAPEQLGSAMEVARLRGITVVKVADALGAVQSLARHHRARLFCPVIGVTGSSGKTTTKDFIYSVISQRAKVVATKGNRNNELGVPLTLFEAGADTDAIVLEMAMRGEGQIATLASIARPTAGLITNIGTSHIEILGSQDAIASAKAELVASIGCEGTVFVNGDDAYADLIASGTCASVIRYGLGVSNEVRAENIVLDEESRPTFDLVTPDARENVTLGLPGRHNVYNALAAAAVGGYMSIPAVDIVTGLQSATITEMRMQAFMTAGGIHVINDAYNANPSSMRAAIETLSAMRAATRRIAVLGDMAELGSLTELAHFRIGEAIKELEIDLLITVGPRAVRIADGARATGMDPSAVFAFDEIAGATAKVLECVAPGDAVLVKASRVIGLERIVDAIVSPE